MDSFVTAIICEIQDFNVVVTDRQGLIPRPSQKYQQREQVMLFLSFTLCGRCTACVYLHWQGYSSHFQEGGGQVNAAM